MVIINHQRHGRTSYKTINLFFETSLSWQLLGNIVEPLNKGHLRTDGIVPYSKVVPYWEVSQKKLNIDVKSPLKNRELIRGALFQ